MKSMASLICCALRVRRALGQQVGGEVGEPPRLAAGSRRAPASSMTRTSTIGRLRCSETSSAAPLGKRVLHDSGAEGGGEGREEEKTEDRTRAHAIPATAARRSGAGVPLTLLHPDVPPQGRNECRRWTLAVHLS